MEGLGVQYLGIDEYNTSNAEVHSEEWRDSDPAWIFASVLEQAGVIPGYSMRHNDHLIIHMFPYERNTHELVIKKSLKGFLGFRKRSYSMRTRKPSQWTEPIVLPCGIDPTGCRIIISALEGKFFGMSAVAAKARNTLLPLPLLLPRYRLTLGTVPRWLRIEIPR